MSWITVANTLIAVLLYTVALIGALLIAAGAYLTIRWILEPTRQEHRDKEVQP